MDAGTLILWILSALFTITGLAGLIIPVIPGPVLLLAGLVMAAWAENFVFVGPVVITILTLLAVLAHALDFLAGAMGVKRFGASRKAVIGAAIGAIFGIFFGFIGILTGPFIGAIVGELTVQRNFQSAGLAGIGAWLGMMVGAAAKIAIGFSMVGIFIIARLF
ncbi:MAG: DUF456 domain-containing protein [Desulfobacteraceae bacterium]|nr:DUF456 family protein [Desulfobacteraceae bacterium]MBC2757225.1 DUF456 domain-containing protein [Desulfobacteraceae bacterium]